MTVGWTEKDVAAHMAKFEGKTVPPPPVDVRDWNCRYRSNLERVFHQTEGALFLRGYYRMTVVALYYEPVRWRIPGGWVKTDFAAVFANGVPLWIELKGTTKAKGYAASRQRFRTAAGCYPALNFAQVVRDGKGWRLEGVRPAGE